MVNSALLLILSSYYYYAKPHFHTIILGAMIM